MSPYDLAHGSFPDCGPHALHGLECSRKRPVRRSQGLPFRSVHSSSSRNHSPCVDAGHDGGTVDGEAAGRPPTPHQTPIRSVRSSRIQAVRTHGRLHPCSLCRGVLREGGDPALGSVALKGFPVPRNHAATSFVWAGAGRNGTTVLRHPTNPNRTPTFHSPVMPHDVRMIVCRPIPPSLLAWPAHDLASGPRCQQAVGEEQGLKAVSA